MKPSDDLFLLIKSLTKTEKRYFKRFCKLYSTDKKNNYLKLFDIIDKQKKYDERKIKVKFRNEKFIKQLNVTKNYLEKLIIKSTRQFYSSNDLDIMIKDMVIHANILYKKRIYPECYRVISTAKKFAYNYEYYSDLSELLSIEKKLNLDLRPKNFEKRINELYIEEETVIKDLILSRRYLTLRNKLYTIILSTGLGHIENSLKIKMEEIISDMSLKNMPITSSNEVKLSFYKCHYMYNLLLHNDDAAQDYSEKILQLFDENKYFREKYERDYYNSLHNITVVYLRTGKINDAKLRTVQLRKILASNKNRGFDINLSKIYVTTFVNELLIYNFTGATDKAKELIDDIIKAISFLRLHDFEYGYETLYFYIAVYYFIVEDYCSSLNYINKFEKSLSWCGKDQIEYLTKMLYSMIKYEMGEYNHLEYYVINTIRWLKTNSEITNDEQTFFRIFSRILKTEQEQEVKYLFNELKKEYVDKQQPTGANDGVYALDIRAWIDAKLNNKKMLEVIIAKTINKDR